MEFIFQPLSQENALIIADSWKYEGDYAFYDMTSDPEDYAEFVSETERNLNPHFQAIMDDELAGFFCIIDESSETEIGLGLRPNLCGQHLGKEFVRQILAYVDKHYTFSQLIMNVATFNQRAIKTYKACGFKTTATFMQETNGSTYEFVRLEL